MSSRPYGVVLQPGEDCLTSTTWITAGPGSTIFVPAAAIQAFRNSNGKPAWHLAIGGRLTPPAPI